MTMGSLGRLAAGVGFSLVALSGRVAAQGATADPWSRVPALPTSCYNDDDFESRMNAAATINNAEWMRQTDVNNRVKAKLDSIDMGERMQRMQAFMVQNPQQAMQAMQAMQAVAQNASTGVLASQGDNEQLERELAADTANFRAAVSGVRDPIQRLIDDLVKTKGTAADEAGGVALPAADIPRYMALVARLNTDYDRVCGAWWGPTGTFPTWVRKYKDYLLRDVVAPAQKADEGVVMQLSIMGLATAGYRSTGPLEAIRDYTSKVPLLYRLRVWRVEVRTPAIR